MTEGLDKLISHLNYGKDFQVSTYTAPRGPSSINDENDAANSSEICLADLEKHLDSYDSFLVACYSVHPLVQALRSKLADRQDQKTKFKPVLGIFESSISLSLTLLNSFREPLTPGSVDVQKFGIVSTGKYWEEALTKGILAYLGTSKLSECRRFKGVETTGLNADELHTAPPDEVESRMKKATSRLLKDGDVKVICLGCAGMAGLDRTVREACIEQLGPNLADDIKIIDGVKAGLGMLNGLLRAPS